MLKENALRIEGIYPSKCIFLWCSKCISLWYLICFPLNENYNVFPFNHPFFIYSVCLASCTVHSTTFLWTGQEAIKCIKPKEYLMSCYPNIYCDSHCCYCLLPAVALEFLQEFRLVTWLLILECPPEIYLQSENSGWWLESLKSTISVEKCTL